MMSAFSLFALLKVYLEINLLLILLAIFTFTLASSSSLFDNTPFLHRLRSVYLLLALSFAAPILSRMVVSPSFSHSSAQIWTASSMKESSLDQLIVRKPPVLKVGNINVDTPVDAEIWLIILLLVPSLMFGFMRLARAGRSIRRLIAQSVLLRKFGSVRVLISSDLIVPCSFWIPGYRFVLLPENMIAEPSKLKSSLLHELQHHRQGDTEWIHVFELVRLICAWNPFVFLLGRSLTRLQEFACDESLIGRQNISLKSYCECLLWVAQNNMHHHQAKLIGTASMASGNANFFLKRRIEVMLTKRKRIYAYSSFAVLTAVGILFGGALFGLAFAAHTSIQDRRITQEKAEFLVANANEGSDFPVELNDLVLAQLNLFLGTPDGRLFIEGSLARMTDYREMLQAKVKEYGVPSELLALPIVESGYRNLVQSEVPSHGAGLWMFIAPTARNFGLIVNDALDERNDATLETDAAFRMLQSLNLQFRDWRLALLAYNMGSRGLLNAMSEAGTRDPWQLEHEGFGNDSGYLAKVIAAVIIMKNPGSLN